MTNRTAEAYWAYVFLSPFLLGLLLFVIGPLVSAILISLTSWDLMSKPVFIGFQNYIRMIHDTLFLKALKNTLIYTVGSMAAGIIPATIFALTLNYSFRGVSIFRSIYLLPSVISIIAVGVSWAWLFNPQFGLINYALSSIGLPKVNWLGDARWALPVVIFVGAWRNMGYAIVILLAGLKTIPNELYDSAKIDGAGWWAQYSRITLPMLSPTNFFLIIMSVIWSFQVFEITYVMTQEGPEASTLTLVYYIWENGFPWYRMGYASSIAFIAFLIMLAICLVMVKYQDKWVHYE